MRAVIKQREVTELDRFIPTGGKRKYSDAENSALISLGEVFLRRFSLFDYANNCAVGVLLVSFLVHRLRCFFDEIRSTNSETSAPWVKATQHPTV